MTQLLERASDGCSTAADLALMRPIDEMHLKHPFAGARMLRDLLRSPCESAHLAGLLPSATDSPMGERPLAAWAAGGTLSIQVEPDVLTKTTGKRNAVTTLARLVVHARRL